MSVAPGSGAGGARVSSVSDTREALLSRVREALGHATSGSRTEPRPPALNATLARLVQPGTDLPAVFTASAAAAGMTVHPCSGARLAGVVRTIVAGVPARLAAIDTGDSDLGADARRGAAEAGARLIDLSAGPGLDPLFDADIGVTDCAVAVAETGSLVMVADRLHSRGTFLVPPVHLAIVRTSQLVPDLLDLWPFLKAEYGPVPSTAIVLVSGPSKTGDIEGVLVTGVHGPREVHIALVHDAV